MVQSVSIGCLHMERWPPTCTPGRGGRPEKGGGTRILGYGDSHLRKQDLTIEEKGIVKKDSVFQVKTIDSGGLLD